MVQLFLVHGTIIWVQNDGLGTGYTHFWVQGAWYIPFLVQGARMTVSKVHGASHFWYKEHCIFVQGTWCIPFLVQGTLHLCPRHMVHPIFGARCIAFLSKEHGTCVHFAVTKLQHHTDVHKNGKTQLRELKQCLYTQTLFARKTRTHGQHFVTWPCIRLEYIGTELQQHCACNASP